MKYMALIYADASRWEHFSPEQREAAYGRYRAFGEEATRANVMLGGAELAPTHDATAMAWLGTSTGSTSCFLASRSARSRRRARCQAVSSRCLRSGGP